MNQRKPTQNGIEVLQKLVSELNYNRMTVHLEPAKYQEAMKEAQEFIANHSIEDIIYLDQEAKKKADAKVSNDEKDKKRAVDLFKELNQKVGIYYLFYKREEKPAIQYLEQHKKLTTPESLEEAEARMFYAVAQTVSGDFDGKEDYEYALNYFRKAKEKLAESDTLALRQLELNEAICLRYIALMYHRKFQTDLALENIEAAIKIEEKYQASFPTVNLDLAESVHIKGVILIRRNELQAAKDSLEQAGGLWETYCTDTEREHSIKYITMQSYGDILRRLGDLDGAEKILETAYNLQLTYFQTNIHVDMGKTLHFLGDVAFDKKNYKRAFELYLHALEVKEQLYKEDSAILQASLNALVKVTNAYFNFDWNDYKTIAENKAKLANIELALKKIVPLQHYLNQDAKNALGDLFYKLGTFHTHVKRNPVAANDALDQAYYLTKDKKLAWVFLHIAFAEQQLFAKANREENQEEQHKHYSLANEFLYKAFSCETADATEIEKKQIEAFYFCLSALIHYENKDLGSTLELYGKAIDIYIDINEIDDQYARALNQYARISAENKQYLAAHVVFEQLVKYWTDHQDDHNPYSERFDSQYANFLLTVDPSALTSEELSPSDFALQRKLNLEKALLFLRKALVVLNNTEGPDSSFTKLTEDKIAATVKLIATLDGEKQSLVDWANELCTTAYAQLQKAVSDKEINLPELKLAFAAFKKANSELEKVLKQLPETDADYNRLKEINEMLRGKIVDIQDLMTKKSLEQTSSNSSPRMLAKVTSASTRVPVVLEEKHSNRFVCK